MKVEAIAVSELKIFDGWADAPKGALVQVHEAGTNDVVHGLRCEITTNGSTRACLLRLNGNERGVIFEEGITGPAIDLSGLGELAVTHINPAEFTKAHYEARGFVCATVGKTKQLLVRAALISSTRVFVQLDPTTLGTVLMNLPSPRMWFVGALEIREKEKEGSS
jgi:hypothetical protein